MVVTAVVFSSTLNGPVSSMTGASLTPVTSTVIVLVVVAPWLSIACTRNDSVATPPAGSDWKSAPGVKVNSVPEIPALPPGSAERIV